MGWPKAAMIVCFASAAGVMAYAISTSAAPSAAPPDTTKAIHQH